MNPIPAKWLGLRKQTYYNRFSILSSLPTFTDGQLKTAIFAIFDSLDFKRNKML